MLTTTYSKKQHALIGKILQRDYPDIFQKIKTDYIDIQPVEKELEKVAWYYIRFPRTENFTNDSRVFITAMLHIYSPQVFIQPSKYRVPRTGLSKMLSRTIGVHERMISYFIDQSLVWYKVDDTFKNRVEETVSMFGIKSPLVKAVEELVPFNKKV